MHIISTYGSAEAAIAAGRKALARHSPLLQHFYLASVTDENEIGIWRGKRAGHNEPIGWEDAEVVEPRR
jgi:hypothetical protein